MKNVEFFKFLDNKTNRKIFDLWGYEAQKPRERESQSLT